MREVKVCDNTKIRTKLPSETNYNRRTTKLQDLLTLVTERISKSSWGLMIARR